MGFNDRRQNALEPPREDPIEPAEPQGMVPDIATLFGSELWTQLPNEGEKINVITSVGARHNQAPGQIWELVDIPSQRTAQCAASASTELPVEGEWDIVPNGKGAVTEEELKNADTTDDDAQQVFGEQEKAEGREGEQECELQDKENEVQHLDLHESALQADAPAEEWDCISQSSCFSEGECINEAECASEDEAVLAEDKVISNIEDGGWSVLIT